MAPPRKKTSLMWNHFTEQPGKKGKCNYCSDLISYTSGTLGNLSRHLKRKHPIISTAPKEWVSLPMDADADDEGTRASVEENNDEAPMPVKQKLFEKVRRYCVALIKECGRPIEMIDDGPFKKLLNLIVHRESDRKQLTASAIKEYMETSVDALEETVMDEDEIEQDVFDNDGDSDYAPPGEASSRKSVRVIKGEKLQCTCLLETDDGDHKIGCPLASAKHYWAYFDVSVDDAKCKECHRNVKWTTMSDLKSHLDVYHSHLPYKDDDDNFTDPQNTTQSDAEDENQTTEEVYLDAEFITQIPPTAKKRKLPSFPPQKYVTLKDNQTITLDRFKCLDRFGLYIAALMKMIPEDKCIKYQEQIVNRLLKEQAAAG